MITIGAYPPPKTAPSAGAAAALEPLGEPLGELDADVREALGIDLHDLGRASQRECIGDVRSLNSVGEEGRRSTRPSPSATTARS